MDILKFEQTEIVEINRENYKDYIHSLTRVIKKAFEVVGEIHEIEHNDQPNFAAFIKETTLARKIDTGVVYIGCIYKDEIVACIGIENNNNSVYSFSNLAVLPVYQGSGFGRELIKRAEKKVWLSQGQKIKIGLIEEDKRRYEWYLALGYQFKSKKEFGKARRGVIFMEKVQFNKKITKSQIQCLSCGLTKGTCICKEAKVSAIKTRIVLLTHESEIKRISNTGRLIQRLFPDNTHIVVWSRTEMSEELASLLNDEDFDNYLVFPKELSPNKISRKTLGTYRNNAFFVIDGTWNEAKKILRKSPYLHDLSIIEMDINNETEYFIRRKSDQHHLCTAEIVMALLKKNHDEVGYSELKAYYGLFLKKYKEARSGVK